MPGSGLQDGRLPGVPATPSPLPGVPSLRDRFAPSQRLTREGCRPLVKGFASLRPIFRAFGACRRARRPLTIHTWGMSYNRQGNFAERINGMKGWSREGESFKNGRAVPVFYHCNIVL